MPRADIREREIKIPLTITLIIRGGGRVCCSKERTIALRFSNVTRENRSRGYQSVISHDIGERYSRNRGRDRLFMQLQRGLMFPETMRKNNDVRTNRVVGSWQKSRFIYIWGGEI